MPQVAALHLDRLNEALIDQGKLETDRVFLISILNFSAVVV